MLSRMRKSQAGLTLVEIAILLVIVCLVVALIYPSVIGRLDEVRVAQARTDLDELAHALERYRFDNQIYPTTEQGLQALIEKPDTEPVPKNWSDGGYLKKARRSEDPWGNPYQYDSPTGTVQFSLFSLGSDGQPGGEGHAADIHHVPAG